MTTTAVMHDDLLELSRRALIADFGATLAEQPEFRRDAELVSAAMPARLARTIHQRGWSVEPRGGDLALELARRYGQGRQRQAVVAVFLREAAAALQCVPPEWTADPHDWALVALMNVGSLAHTPVGQAAGVTRRPSAAALSKRERGCQAIARRGAGRCIVCGTTVHPTRVNGDVRARSIQPLTCSPACADEERHHVDAMASVFKRCAWLADETMVLDVDFLPYP